MSENKNLKPDWKVWRFDQMATNVNVRIDNPSESGMEHYVGLEHLDSDSLKIRRWGTPADVEATKLMFEAGDIIFARRRAYQRKLGVAEFNGICSAHALVLRAKPDVVVPEFLPFFMQSDLFMNRAVEISVGSLSPTINWKTMAAQEFSLPSKEEQARIVEVLAAARKSLDLLREAESSSNRLFERLVLDTFAPRRENYHNSDPLKVFPANWSVSAMEDLCQSESPICYGIVQVGDNDPSGIPTVQIKDLSSDFSGSLHRTKKDIESAFSRSRIYPGDVLISVKAIIGEVACVPPAFTGNISRDVARLRPGPNIDSSFLVMLLRSPPYRRYIQKYVVGSTRDELSIGTLKKLRVPYPDREQQASIVALLDDAKMASKRFEQRSEAARKLVSIFLQEAL
ncbi:restriction endonuclease subunit S [Pseudomonas sp. 17391]|uniref:restriction endonuclease subunit S n=1 Tax=Pseudomonas sp. 17391 TaxID=2967217 RepID=UPI00236345CD|nr:restriction endonuclease subunit S [Pseudomonas sp. 17391]MDD2128356.1 restriction endonuclease subunit S [Pseudomonas sp. 17391]